MSKVWLYEHHSHQHYSCISQPWIFSFLLFTLSYSFFFSWYIYVYNRLVSFFFFLSLFLLYISFFSSYHYESAQSKCDLVGRFTFRFFLTMERLFSLIYEYGRLTWWGFFVNRRITMMMGVVVVIMMVIIIHIYCFMWWCC